MIENNETMPSLGIYPEGVAHNCSAIGTFKKGSFRDFRPVKVIGFKVAG